MRYFKSGCRFSVPAPEQGAHGSGRYEPPQGETEETLARIMQEVLRTDRIGREDNFFDLGGHSLMAARLMWRLRATSGFSLPMRHLFERPTVAGLAEAIDALQWLQKSTVPTHSANTREEIVL